MFDQIELSSAAVRRNPGAPHPWIAWILGWISLEWSFGGGLVIHGGRGLEMDFGDPPPAAAPPRRPKSKPDPRGAWITNPLILLINTLQGDNPRNPGGVGGGSARPVQHRQQTAIWRGLSKKKVFQGWRSPASREPTLAKLDRSNSLILRLRND